MFIKNSFIVDGSYMLHRALHVPETMNLHDSKDRGTGGIFMFFRLFLTELKNMGVDFAVPLVVFDSGLSAKRLSVYDDYKKSKQKQEQKLLYESGQMDEELAKAYEEDQLYVKEYHTQMGVISTVLKNMGVPVLKFDGWEGDDIVTICTRISMRGTVITDDKDMIQLLSPAVKIRRPMHNDILLYEDYQKENNDPEMRKFVYEKAISGDPSDNIPQVAVGIGAKSAKTIAGIIVDNPEDWQEKVKNDKSKRIRNFFDPEKNADVLKNLARNMELVDLSKVDSDAELISSIFNEILSSTGNVSAAYAILSDYEIKDVDMAYFKGYMEKTIEQNPNLLRKQKG